MLGYSRVHIDNAPILSPATGYARVYLEYTSKSGQPRFTGQGDFSRFLGAVSTRGNLGTCGTSAQATFYAFLSRLYGAQQVFVKFI